MPDGRATILCVWTCCAAAAGSGCASDAGPQVLLFVRAYDAATQAAPAPDRLTDVLVLGFADDGSVARLEDGEVLRLGEGRSYVVRVAAPGYGRSEFRLEVPALDRDLYPRAPNDRMQLARVAWLPRR